MSEERQSRAEDAMALIVAKIEMGQIDVFRNVLGEAYISLKIPDEPQGNHRLNDELVRTFIANFIWERCRVVLHEREITRILAVLAGRATKTRRAQLEDPAVLKLLRSEPVIAVVYEFMYSHPSGVHEARAERLWKEWWEFASERGLLQFGKNRFPAGENVLSRLLRHYRVVLTTLGIDLTIRRSNGCHITLRRLSDDSTAQSSPEPSIQKSLGGKGLHPMDGKDAMIERLRYKKSQGAEDDDRTRSP